MEALLARDGNSQASQFMEVLESDRSSVLSFLSGNVSCGNRYAPQSGEIVGILKQLRDGMSADLSDLEKEKSVQRTNNQGLMKAITEEISVLTKGIGETTVRQGTLAVEVEKLKSEFSEAEKTLLTDKELASKLKIATPRPPSGRSDRG